MGVPQRVQLFVPSGHEHAVTRGNCGTEFDLTTGKNAAPRWPVNPQVPGSSPGRGAKQIKGLGRNSWPLFLCRDRPWCLQAAPRYHRRDGAPMDLSAFLAAHGIDPACHAHPPVMTVAESERLVPPLPGAKTKNLFLRDRKGARHFLVTVPHALAVDLAALGEVLDAGRLGFASPDRLLRHLGIAPGSVSLLALVNDTARAVEFVIDRAPVERRGRAGAPAAQRRDDGHRPCRSGAISGGDGARAARDRRPPRGEPATLRDCGRSLAPGWRCGRSRDELRRSASTKFQVDSPLPEQVPDCAMCGGKCQPRWRARRRSAPPRRRT